MAATTFNCSECDRPVEPVWAHYDAQCALAGASASGKFRLPMHTCPEGHIDGWRPGHDYLVDLADNTEFVYSAELSGGTVEPQRRLLGRSRCGNCSMKLHLRKTGRRLVGTVRAEIASATHAAEFELDVPEVVCATCGARPRPDARAIANTPADVQGWIFQLIADAMPPERATRIEQRA